MGYKTTDGLMCHLQEHGIAISGNLQKRRLVNTGYFHGYKGYRFFQAASKRLPVTSYNEIYATIQYDSKLKALFYDKVMFIETAVKSHAIECILTNANSENIQDICDKVVSGYKNAPVGATAEQKKTIQQRKLNLQGSIQSSLSKAYHADNPKITHFYNNMNYTGVPIWALVEIMTMGDFGFFLSCLTWDVRNDISKSLGINVSADTNRELVYKYLYTLKDLRNAIAHNDVVFDARFKKIDPTKPMKRCLELEMGLHYVNFKTIGDYMLLICYYLKILGVSETELSVFIREFERITDEYKNAVNSAVAAIVVHPDLPYKLSQLKIFI